MFTYSTCSDCRGLLHVTDSETAHPACTPRLSKVEQLAVKWRDATEAGDLEGAEELQRQVSELDARPPRLLDAALTYARWGWPVFPLRQADGRCDGDAKCRDTGICQCSKKPATRHGFKDATTDVDRIEKWWTSHPASNIGLATGHRFDVIDVDTPDGTYSFADLLDGQDPATGRGAIPDCHGMTATASGGIHLYVKPTGKGNTVRIAPGIDYRGAGGYVVAAPSTLGRPGRSWSWTVKPSPMLTGVGDVYA